MLIHSSFLLSIFVCLPVIVAICGPKQITYILYGSSLKMKPIGVLDSNNKGYVECWMLNAFDFLNNVLPMFFPLRAMTSMDREHVFGNVGR